ncbi:MAG: P-II family nitrogen regulator [Aureispira sp.]
MSTYNKIEIILSDIYLETLIQHLETLGVTGYTVLPINKSKGPKRGEQQLDGLLPTSNNSLFFTVVSPALSQVILSKIQPFLDKISGVLIVSAVSSTNLSSKHH